MRESTASLSAQAERKLGLVTADQSNPAEPLAPIGARPDPLTAPAFHGLAGDVVRLIEPHSEADPAALVMQTLVGFGNLVGHGPHYDTDASRQHTNENIIIVGPTSAGRKGTAWSQVRSLLCHVDPEWAKHRIRSGLSSGEGLTYHVRDRLGDDPGVDDKRLFIVESEMAATFKVLKREGNTLSPTARAAWDNSQLGGLTKHEPTTATDAHISIVGHITPDELRRLLDHTDVANGFLNRFMLVAVCRSKCLPDGGSPAERDMMTVASVVRDVAIRAKDVGLMTRNADARELWHSVYQELTERPGGLLGSATSRAAPHVVRLSCLYALLDGVAVVGRDHLEAALAVWRYVEDSTRFFLGDSLGDPIADSILDALRASPAGLSRTDLHRLKCRHASADAIDGALQRLVMDGLAAPDKKPTKGRPAQIWKAAKYAKEAQEGMQ